MRNYIFGFNTNIQFRIGYQSQAKSSLEQGQVSGGPAAHPHQNFCLVPPSPPAPTSRLWQKVPCPYRPYQSYESQTPYLTVIAMSLVFVDNGRRTTTRRTTTTATRRTITTTTRCTRTCITYLYLLNGKLFRFSRKKLKILPTRAFGWR